MTKSEQEKQTDLLALQTHAGPAALVAVVMAGLLWWFAGLGLVSSALIGLGCGLAWLFYAKRQATGR